ncbi:MAG: DUF4091 domain-containing protein [Myxococcales bacterium]
MLSCVAAALVASSSVQIWIADESEKVMPDAAPRPTREAPRIRLTAAGSECAGAQIVVRSEKGVKALTASAQPLLSGKQRIPLDLMRVATIKLARPTEPEGRAGEWPDALIPVRDPIYGETRRAFPVDVGAGRAQSIFVEACVPGGFGDSHGGARFSSSVQLEWIDSSAKFASAKVPVDVKVRAFDLPVTPTLATAFGFSGWSAAKGHKRGPEANLELTRVYHTIALRRGITLQGGSQTTPPYEVKGDDVIIDWKLYDDEVAAFLDGTALPSGARWTSVDFREPTKKLNRAQRRSWRRAWVKHFQQRGWLDRLYAYVEDEPAPKDFARVEEHARELREDAPAIRRLVTTALSDKLPSIDLWVPLLNCLGDESPNCPRPIARQYYREQEKKGATLWWYQSCMSHGCDPSGVVPPRHRAAFTGWPDYVIDVPATAARVMGTLGFANGIAGELYYDVVYSYDFSDPWELQYAFGGNGDGTLYYPGTPARIGGDKDVPIETLRIVQIQRGIQDYEYLALCKKLGDGKLAADEARALAPAIRRFSRDPKAYSSMRATVGARIEVLTAERRSAAPAVGHAEADRSPRPEARGSGP